MECEIGFIGRQGDVEFEIDELAKAMLGTSIVSSCVEWWEDFVNLKTHCDVVQLSRKMLVELLLIVHVAVEKPIAINCLIKCLNEI